MDPRELGLLVNALRNKDHGFFLAEVDGTLTRDDLLLKLNIAMGQVGKKTALLDFSSMAREETIIAFIDRHSELLHDCRVVCLINFTSPYSPVEEINRFFHRLNQTREQLERLQKDWVFILSPVEHGAFRSHARDLYSWTPQRFVLHGRMESPRNFSRALCMEERRRFSGDKDREYLRGLISLYEEQVRNAAGDAAYRIRNIVIPLADLYAENDQPSEELPLRREILEFLKQEGDREEIAAGLVNLGIAYANLPTGDRGENLRLAIAAFQETLEIYTAEAFPEEHEMITGNLKRAMRLFENDASSS